MKDFFKIVVTGPESTGKTALAEALAKRAGALWVPEFARYYVAHLGRPYERNDLKMIGLGQKMWEDWYAVFSDQSLPKRRALICDTDWTVLHIWEHYRFAQNRIDLPLPNDAPTALWQTGYGSPDLADLYLLCRPDFPWQPDPLRENPDERDVLFNMYDRLLRGCNAKFIILSGDHEARLQTALAAVRELF